VNDAGSTGLDNDASLAEYHSALLNFIVKKDDDYLGFGCKKFCYFKKNKDKENSYT
jgi:hypothetical protein